MALAPFFDRVYGAVGAHLSVSRDSLVGALDSKIVGVVCGDLTSRNDRWIAEFSVNLLARLYPRLKLSASEPIRSDLVGIARSINPSIEIDEVSSTTVDICIGGAPVQDGLYPSASGWVARLDHAVARPSGSENPYAAAAAATLACAEVFRRVFGLSSIEQDVSVSLLAYDDCTGSDQELRERDLGEVLVAGVGAVGNAALWVLARDAHLRGHLILLDQEALTIANMQRYVLGRIEDLQRAKIELGAREFVDSAITVDSARNTLEEFAEAHNGVDAPTVMVSVDNVESRRAAQALLPRLVVNGWTGDAAAGASWHEFARDAACLACLYHPHGPGLSITEQAARALGLNAERTAILWATRSPLSSDDLEAVSVALGVEISKLAPWRGKPLGDLYTDVVCGAVPLDIAGVGRLEVVPLAHQSALAGILMAAELVKRTDPSLEQVSQRDPLVTWGNVLQPAPALWTQPRAKERGCICGDDDYQAVYRERWKSLNSFPV